MSFLYNNKKITTKAASLPPGRGDKHQAFYR